MQETIEHIEITAIDVVPLVKAMRRMSHGFGLRLSRASRGVKTSNHTKAKAI